MGVIEAVLITYAIFPHIIYPRIKSDEKKVKSHYHREIKPNKKKK